MPQLSATNSVIPTKVTCVCVCVYFSNHNFYSEPEGLLCASNLYNVESSFFWLDDVDCKGDESGLLECAHGAIGKHDCTNKELAGARCEESGMYILITTSTGSSLF